MNRKRSLALAALASLGLAVPAGAQAQGGGPHLTKRELRGVPGRVTTRLRRAERALQRTEDYLDENDNAHAVTALGAVNKNLAAATKTTIKKISGGATGGPAAARATSSVADDVIESTSGDFDGVTDADVITALTSSLNAGIDDRDQIVAAIAALSDGSDYQRVLAHVNGDATNESSDIDDALADDTLTDDSTSALNAAKTKLAATASATADAASSDSTSDASDTSSDPGSGNCPHGGRPGGAPSDTSTTDSSGSGSSSGDTTTQSRRGFRS